MKADARPCSWGKKVLKYHRTLTTYINTLVRNGFEIQHVMEPQPPESMMHLPGMRDEMRRPMMLLVAARKKIGRGPIGTEVFISCASSSSLKPGSFFHK